MKLFKGMILALSLVTLVAQAEVKVKSMELDATGDKVATMKIHYSGDINGTPELNVGKDHVQVVITGAVWPKIEKKAHLVQANDSTLMAYQFDKNVVRARAVIPMNFLGNETAVKMKKTPGLIEVTFPKSTSGMTAAVNTNTGANKEQYDEAYLDTLSKEKKPSTTVTTIAAAATTTETTKTTNTIFNPANRNDEVTTKLAAPAATDIQKPTFSIMGYIGKFVAFLGVVLLLFYGVVQLMKKGVLGKGKLGFLNNSNLVEVLSTTYIAPKRSLMLVKAHKQIFLVSNSESGVQFLSEITDTSGLVKQGEKEALGNNFDSALDSAALNENADKKIRLKQMIAATDTFDNDLAQAVQPNEDKVSFSSELKKKMKGLRPLSN
ncbi:MAG: FliO/MopB family protein [Bacteriovoracaceae bacterium]